jgi:hypothetical protein
MNAIWLAGAHLGENVSRDGGRQVGERGGSVPINDARGGLSGSCCSSSNGICCPTGIRASNHGGVWEDRYARWHRCLTLKRQEAMDQQYVRLLAGTLTQVPSRRPARSHASLISTRCGSRRSSTAAFNSQYPCTMHPCSSDKAPHVVPHALSLQSP